MSVKGASGGSKPSNASTVASLGRTRSALAEGLGSVGNIQLGGIPDNVPLFGGWLRVVQGAISSGADVTVTHGLKVIPRFLWVLGEYNTAPAAPGFAPPSIYAGSVAWTQSQVTVRFNSLISAGRSVAFLIF